MKATIEFSEIELVETFNRATKLNSIDNKSGVPSKNKEVAIELDLDKKRAIVKGKKGNFFQFFGHQYAKRLTSIGHDKTNLFENVGNIYWYTEQRTSYSINDVYDQESFHINSIRSFLASAYNFHLAVAKDKRKLEKGEFDFYESLSTMYSTVFSDRNFVGTTPRFDVFEKSIAPDFILTDGKNQYELAEMSAGERAIFPILMDFARYNINNSIIIIDEIELHLHAPLQQAFIRALTQLGKNNQFILTTHSDNVTAMFDESENQIIRLNG